MHVGELWRYPVKSLKGERLDEVEIRADGLVGDRFVHVRSDCGRVVTIPRADDGTETKRECRRGRQRERSIERIGSSLVVALHYRDDKASGRERRGVVASDSDGLARVAQSDSLRFLFETPA